VAMVYGNRATLVATQIRTLVPKTITKTIMVVSPQDGVEAQ